MKCPNFLPWVLVILLIILGGNYGYDSGERNINQAQPRMSSEGGNLVFHSGSAKNIEFRTGSQGRIKLNEEDVADVFSQIQRNKDEILELKRLTSTSHNVSSEIIQLKSQIVNIEGKLHNLELTFLKKACNSNPCQNSGICINLLDAFFCLCPNNWQGPDCSVDVNECQIYEGTSLGCQNGATCVNKPGDYSCICTPETYGQYCTSKFDDCQGGSSLLCEHGVCVDGNREQLHQPNYTCICDDGWMSPPGSLACNADIDECSLTNPPCSMNPPVRCVNIPGFYFCDPCPAGYEGNGKVCTLINICSVNNGGCHPLAVCNNISGPVPNCVCPDGYTGNGYGSNGCFALSSICQTHNPCVNGQCLDTVSGYNCECDSGWIGINCTENIECGGELTSMYGTIYSPGYPGNYLPNRDCYWIISTNPGLLITFAFGILSLEHHDNCTQDYLEIRDGLLSQDPLLRKYCSSGLPPPLQTTGSHAWVHFHSNGFYNDRGFHITYITSPVDPSCGGNYTESSGVIMSPYWPSSYLNNRQCVYIIQQPPNEKIYLNFTHLELERLPDCSLNYIEIRDGDTVMAPLISKFCGRLLPSIITSNQSSLWIKFKSDISVNTSNFRATYEVACGGRLSGEGVIRSPYFSRPLPKGHICEWIIAEPEDNIVILNFTDFRIYNVTTCNSDYVEIRNGGNANSPSLGKYCGVTIPPVIHSGHNLLYIKFSASSSTNLGFMAEYKLFDKACGGIITEPDGILASPGYLNIYPHGVRCLWTIIVQPGYLIHLTFTYFSLEFDYNCLRDYLEIYDNSTMTKIGRYCGRSIPPSITSSGNTVTLHFVTNRNIASEGFSVNYASRNASTVCSHEYRTASGVLTSPNYPNKYPVNMICVYKIHVANNKQIALHFTNFSLENGAMCLNDYLEIRDGGYETSPLFGKYCDSSLPPVIISHSNNLWLKFVSDIYLTDIGFSAYWDGTSTGCGGILTTSSGILMSPNYPMPYFKNAECYWLLKSSHGSVLEIYFDQFHLESHPSCYFDYLAVYDGNSSNSRMLGKFCGNQIPRTIRSTSSNMYIKLRTDHSLNGRGFHAHFKQVCQGIVIANQSQGILESLDYPNNYPPGVYCNWTIQTTTGNTLNYSFQALSTKGGDRCERDHLKLYDGPNAQSALIGTFCGDSVLPSGSTMNSSLHVVFFSDQIDESTGFQLLWKVNGCGGEFFESSGSFHSPGYPNKNQQTRECYWYIHTAPGSSIQLTILEFDVEYNSSCNHNILEIYGGYDSSSPRLAQVCTPRSSQNPLHVSSTGNAITVRFKTSGRMNRKGFNASWQETAGGCGGIFQSPQGEIYSPNYPQPYGNNTDCSWVLRVDKGHRIMLNFTDIQIEPHITCSFDYVAVFDGPNREAQLLGKVCGVRQPSPFTSTQNTMFVRFRSDSSIHLRGFRAWFTEVCGSVLEADSVGGAISSPLYPSMYPNNQNCSWIIRAQEPFNHVTLSFTDFDTENDMHNCNTDYVEIREGDNSNAPLQGHYCGSIMPFPVTSFGNALSINFVSNNATTAKGFHATFTASTSACGGTFHMERGAFNSPSFPEPYPLNIECVWNLLSSPGNRLQLSFTDFQVEESENCTRDYIEIREGNFNGSLVGRYCGNSLPVNYTSITGHILWVKFVSDGFISGRGFQATFTHLFGNSIIGTDGQIASPLWPRKYPHFSDYRWMITVNETQVIHGDIAQMDINDLNNCYNDKLKIYDGPNKHSRLIGTYCGITPSSFTSSGNSVTLQFISDSYVNGKGFLLDWYAMEASTNVEKNLTIGACGGLLTAGEAPFSLFSPDWPSKYRNFADCTWLIRAQDSTVEFNLLTLDIESHGSCSDDKLVFRDGDNNLARVLSIVCGREPHGPIRSTGNAMFIHFTSDSSITGAGFNASFHKSCGGTLHADKGEITSPNYPFNYPPNLSCSWHVLVPDGFIIGIHFEEPFHVLNNDTFCIQGDYVELRNGPDFSAPPLGPENRNGRFCGNSTFPTMFTTDNQLFVYFKTGNSNGSQGFKLSYEAKGLACGGNVYITQDNPFGFISSPNYPENYPAFADCIWTITVPYGTAVELQFEDIFDIQTSPNCTLDYLELRDGADSTAQLIIKLCGTSMPGIQRSSGSSLYMRFQSNSLERWSGFKAKYSRAACGGTLTGQNGFIESVGFPELSYPDNLLCEWFLHGPENHYLIISFEALDIQYSSECTKDYLVIQENGVTGDLLGRYCGNSIPAAVVTASNLAYIKFVTDESTNAQGFRLHFAASADECGGELSGTMGTFSSPNYPNHSLHKLKCEWRIIVPFGRRITLTIDDMNFGPSQNCSLNYLEVYNGIGEKTPKLSKLCGVVTPGTQVKSSGNKIMVVMVTRQDDSEARFRITYTSNEDAVCGGLLLSSDNGNLTSPGYNGTSNYIDNLNCEWIIQNPQPFTTTIYLSVEDFHLEQHINCQKDYVDIRQGDSDGELLYRLCGQRPPLEPLLIAASQIWVQFLSNSENTDKGFIMRYSSSDCGGVKQAERGIISSPNYPHPYNSFTHCSWLLIAPEEHTINLTFVAFKMEKGRNCMRTSVIILNGGSPISPVIGRYCGTTSPGTIQSGSNKLLIHFHSNHSGQGDGFNATWTADSLGCGGILHKENGTITSPYWPENFPNNIRCSWTIITHESKHFEIIFDENFQIPNSNGHCQNSYVKVLRGRDKEQEDIILAAGCGNSAPKPIVTPGNVMTIVFQSQDSSGRGFSASFISSCGANLTASSSHIVSPNFPGQYDNNLNCNYFLEAGSQDVVILSFENFDLQAHNALEYCAFDGVKIFKKSAIVETLCGNKIPSPISIVGSTLLNFYTDSHTVGTGFLITYRVIPCGGTFNVSRGKIKSPTHSFTEYHHNMNCSYHITVGNNKIVALKFNSFHLEASSSCLRDYVAVYDGPSIVSPLLGKFCGAILPSSIKSSSNNLLLIFRTDAFGAGNGWEASFRETIGPQQGCGGYLTNANYNFGSPDSDKDGKYDKDVECLWVLAAPINKLINLTFDTFELEAASIQNCRYDYVKLYDGSDEDANLVGTFCGSSCPTYFLSTDNLLTVKFVTDMLLERAGFTATYTIVDRLCGGIYNATAAIQTTATPYFPYAYPPLTFCRWIIDAPPKQQVKVAVLKFHLQPSQDCSQNYLEFQDLPMDTQEHADHVHRFCASDNFTVLDFYSNRQTAIVIFRSDAYMINNGFQFTYQASGCNREYNQSFGYLKSPGWPDLYPHNSDCTIILRSPINHMISLFFSSFSLENFGCQHDYLEVRNGSDISSPLIGKYCGNTLPYPIFPKNHLVYLHFKSDLLLSNEGYEITWTSSPTACGGILYGESGSVASPEYPVSYQNQTDCEWTIIAPQRRNVTVNFAYINIDDPGDCISNFLKLYNGPDSSYPSIGTYCGSDTNIAPLTAMSDQVFIKFHADYVTRPSAFRLTWTS